MSIKLSLKTFHMEKWKEDVHLQSLEALMWINDKGILALLVP